MKLKAIAKLIKNRRELPRFEGRRSLDKKRGEVIECNGDDDPPVVEHIDLPNFEGEQAASERAEVLSDEWTAAEILKIINS